jgi:hypothetical protein
METDTMLSITLPERETHYPAYNVLDMIDEWDSHTKEIVRRRLEPLPEREFFTDREAWYIGIIARHMVYDYRDDIIEWIICHFDRKLGSAIGESQRKRGTPPETVLVREGLKALDHVSHLSFGRDFGELDEKQQFEILAGLQLGKAPKIPQWSQVPQKDLFDKLVSEIVAAYYSHPAIWSEIGYGGPMYPRTYVRVELGLTEPWEARRTEQNRGTGNEER